MLRHLTLFLMLLALRAVSEGKEVDGCLQTVVVNALDGRGMPVGSLLTSDFKATSRGQEVNIVSSRFSQNVGGRTVVLLDTSGSMNRKSNKWRIALTAASEFVSSAPPQREISFMAFADKITQKFIVADGRKAINDWLQSPTRDPMNLKGRTALYETILEAAKELEPIQPGDAIYVISDGGDNKSSETMSRLDRELQAVGVRLFAFLLNDAITEEEGLGARDLYELIRRSGGFLVSMTPQMFGFTVKSGYDYDDKLATAIRISSSLIEAEMGSFYILGVRPLSADSKPAEWKVEAREVQRHKRKDLRMAYPSRLSGCANLQTRSH
jgi:hypothetical protein